MIESNKDDIVKVLEFLAKHNVYIKDKTDRFPVKIYPNPTGESLVSIVHDLINTTAYTRGDKNMFPNPLLVSILNNEQVKFSVFDHDYVEPALDYLLSKSKEAIKATTERYQTVDDVNAAPSVDYIFFPMEVADDQLNRLWNYFSHIHSVNNDENVSAVYEKCSKKLTEYGLEVGQDKTLYQLYANVKQSALWDNADVAWKKTIENGIRGFTFSGINLEPPEQEQFNDISKRISDLKLKISQNVLQCQDSFAFHTDDVNEIKGLPSQFVSNAEKEAQKQNLSGYTLTLASPVVSAVLTFCDNRSLREKFYKANVTVASDQGTFSNEWDNTPLIKEMLDLKKSKAKLLGFDSIAHLSLETKMAESPQHVINFLNDIAGRVRPSAENDLAEVSEYALKTDGIQKLEPWDVSYYSEKLREEKFSFSEEQVREYFPVETVLEGLFNLVERLYGVNIVKVDNVDVWNPDVMCYDVGKSDTRIATFYMDLFARKGKRSGAWMAEWHNRWKRANGTIQLPVTFLTCNFNKSLDEAVPSMLSHDDVITLFHEFGHGLHHMLTQINISGVSGINGVQWDAVELPSQFMENWCWEPSVVGTLSKHYKTGEQLPPDLLKSMIDAKNFQSGLFLTRQVCMGLFDMTLHSTYDTSTIIHDVVDDVYGKVAVMQPPEYNRFECSFMHIFSGGYTAGYYSYLWAEVLSSDVFARFQEEGLFSSSVSQDFANTILAKGGSQDAMELFKEFRGREPSMNAFLKFNGIGV